MNVYEQVTEKIIDKLNQGIIPWHMPWTAGGKIKPINLHSMAFNRASKRVYSTLNQWLLCKPGEWASFKQWNELGGKIKKGAKGSMVVFWKILQKKETLSDGSEKIVTIPVLKSYYVFHIDDVEGVEPLKEEEIKEEETKFSPDELAEQIISEYQAREGIDIRFGGNKAFYSPMGDYIQVPGKDQYKEEAEYYSTLFHEITHSTGHKNRLDRDIMNHFGSERYSKEELVAEIGAAGMLSELGISTEKCFDNSVAYIQSWIKVLANDTKMIVSASSKAEKAINYIINGKADAEGKNDEGDQAVKEAA